MLADSTALPEQAVRDVLGVGLSECRPALLGAAHPTSRQKPWKC
jgi:hypothetical protein